MEKLNQNEEENEQNFIQSPFIFEDDIEEAYEDNPISMFSSFSGDSGI